MFISRVILNFTHPPVGCKLCDCSVWGEHFDFCVKAFCQVPEHTMNTPTAPVPVLPPTFKTAFFRHKIRSDGIIRPRPYNWFWPACRARKVVKHILGPAHTRTTYDWNIKFIADKAGLPPQEVLVTNPIVVGRALGLADETMRAIIDKYDYPKLLDGWSNPYWK